MDAVLGRGRDHHCARWRLVSLPVPDPRDISHWCRAGRGAAPAVVLRWHQPLRHQLLVSRAHCLCNSVILAQFWGQSCYSGDERGAAPAVVLWWRQPL
jgi:hypothetical protein